MRALSLMCGLYARVGQWGPANALTKPRKARKWALEAVRLASKAGCPDIAFTANYIAGVCK